MAKTKPSPTSDFVKLIAMSQLKVAVDSFTTIYGTALTPQEKTAMGVLSSMMVRLATK